MSGRPFLFSRALERHHIPNNNSQRANAYHEAGHAVAAIVFGTGLVSVDVRPKPVPGGGIGQAGADFARLSDSQILGRGENAVMPYLVTFIAGCLVLQP